MNNHCDGRVWKVRYIWWYRIYITVSMAWITPFEARMSVFTAMALLCFCPCWKLPTLRLYKYGSLSVINLALGFSVWWIVGTLTITSLDAFLRKKWIICPKSKSTIPVVLLSSFGYKSIFLIPKIQGVKNSHWVRKTHSEDTWWAVLGPYLAGLLKIVLGTTCLVKIDVSKSLSARMACKVASGILAKASLVGAKTVMGSDN